jgi:prepilin-type N-terminal cleavage/methylation domain-containing protein/prepilin-type processing-associated H-X9-DG protein
MTCLNRHASSIPRRVERCAFTLIELLVVIAIIGVLVALLLPGVQMTREAARRSSCTNNMKQIGIAMHNYHAAHNKLPYTCGYCIYGSPKCHTGGTWAAFLLPYIEQQAVYDLFDFNYQLENVRSERGRKAVVSTYLCPADPVSSDPILPNRWLSSTMLALSYPVSMGPTQPDECYFCPSNIPGPNNWCCQGAYYGTAYPDANGVGMFMRYPKSIAFRQVTDGLAKTFMAGETIPGHCLFNGAYTENFSCYPTNIPVNTMESDNGVQVWANWARVCGFKSYHPGGANFVMGDASVHFIAETIDFQLYNNLGTRAGREQVEYPIP